MKKLTLTLALILSTLMSFSQTKDSDGHTLVALWKTYYKAVDADKPQDKLKALDAIKQEASARHLAWDFYDAIRKYVDVRVSVNWKDRETARADMEKELNDFGEPVALYYYYRSQWGTDKIAGFLKDNKERLQATFNPEFHNHDSALSYPVYSAALLPLIKDDYEYVLWSGYLSREVPDIHDYYGETYPQAAFVEYSDAIDYSESIAIGNLKSYVRKYDGKAVALMGRQRILRYDFGELNKQRDPSSPASKYIDLRKRCDQFEKDRAAFKGDEKVIADCCTEVKDLIETLDAKDINLSAFKGEVTLSLQNIKSLRIIVKDENEKQVWSENVVNKAASYFVRDIVTVKLPAFDDGTYEIECKAQDVEESAIYHKYTLSMAARAIADGYGAYVAEYDTGKPLQKCDFILYNADHEEILRENSVALDGFTPLPEKIRSRFKDGNYTTYYLRAAWKDVSGRNRLSNEIRTHSPHPGRVTPVTNYPSKNAYVLTDRGAYNPGETLHFKAVVYVGTYEYEFPDEGTEVTAELFDPQGNSIGKKTLKTNALGSVAGSFELTGGSRGGMYKLEVRKDKILLGRRSVRVDEFVLPTFTVTWDQDNTMYFGGDEIRVSGKVASYSGHNLGSVKARIEMESYIGSDIDINPDGTFVHTFKCGLQPYRYTIPVTLKITDDTGETLEFNTWKRINDGIPLSAELLNKVKGEYHLSSAAKSRYYGSDWIIRDSFARIRFSTAGLERDGLKITYEIKNEDGKVLLSGSANPQEIKDLDISDEPSGKYTLVVKATAPWKGKGLQEAERTYDFIKAEDDDTALDMDVSCFFKELGGEDIGLQVGATDGPVWVAVELIGSGNVLLEHQVIHLRGERGKSGSLQTVSYKRKENYPETLTLNMLFFRDGNTYEYSRTIKLPVIVEPLKLEFTRFTELAAPGDKVSFIIQTSPDIECAATVFDKATETINSNYWSVITPSRRPEPSVEYNSVCGFDGVPWRVRYDNAGGRDILYKTAGAAMDFRSAEVMEDALVQEMAMPEAAMAEEASGDAPLDEVKIRENFNATMAWEPFLRSDKDGKIDFSFDGGDRLSTYYVQLFAHGEGMKNATLRREMKVTIPVKVSIVQPLFLYGGDEYTARVSLSSSMEVPVSGRVSIRFYDGEDYKTAPVVATKSAHLTIPAGGSIPFSAPYDVPADIKTLGILVNFVADNPEYGSDAVFVSVPVKTALQTLTEAHSSVFLAGQDRDALIASLRAEFVNADASALVPVERDILAMIREAIPDSIEPKSTNVLSLTEAYYSNVIARSVGAPGLPEAEMAEIMKKIAACQNAGGGIAWFEGMESSPMVTAAILQRIAAMPGEDTSSIDVEAAVKYLDKAYFGRAGQPWWCGSISLEYYLQTRALFPSVKFSAPSGKVFRQFKKDVKEYLVPSKARGLDAKILAKARRLRTLQSLVQLPEGKSLAKNWGISLRSKLVKSLDADVESLLQYAVKHRCGGCYYPNAVMPWRGLLESELYAHSLLCDLFTNAANWKNGSKVAKYATEARDTAEGIRLWIMIQKETQQWDKDAAYIEAIASVLRGTPETLATKVILLSTTFTKPFPEVKAAGNGFTLKRTFTVNGNLINEGDTVKVGDRVLARYIIWNEENRSFVRLTAHRPASMRPVAQLSGHIGWWLRPLSYGSWSFTPQGYRNVLADKTEYWFDTYPEENTTITEEFFVTQEGSFQTPAVEIESLYAPHYRANDNGRGPLVSQ